MPFRRFRSRCLGTWKSLASFGIEKFPLVRMEAMASWMRASTSAYFLTMSWRIYGDLKMIVSIVREIYCTGVTYCTGVGHPSEGRVSRPSWRG